MAEPRIEQFDKAVKMREASTDALMDYRKDYSLYFSFEFWLMAAILIAIWLKKKYNEST